MPRSQPCTDARLLEEERPIGFLAKGAPHPPALTTVPKAKDTQVLLTLSLASLPFFSGLLYAATK